MGFSFSHLVVLLLVILIVFGAGKLPKVMGDLGRGIKNFRDGIKGEDNSDKKLTHDYDKNNLE
ncbi:twin arginine translocase protein A [Rickettsiales bacterium Ac37b]|nr:twin arginine translocase protein A [Rickettsiales bacterium Ac37b]